ncbi:2-oxo-4-hydroxy-4-carboxy--5-ureidoimidazoline (OHCU) decarboxylase [Streptomyces griseochromogenes]|uniref:2-oxo-4-hydroxy-4-carboxy-5-ureidoimidazoline decarboxylase n=1 Tax=Streptomyces griseochromogenes TaxID=68214 RepID=A0A1B1AR44_9ACTN|nr:2-oxo-4-hydroxy-4-carboxy-5-ureidoimidazoline decarboxylase [Streptomyces griseochromogenes]ANP49033.1 2-oxo-4-hydroxy-4-carboxy-5-ureidoimidazoline decarboxylase [Streptomyces griseochromogenes]MBP2049453.1 2-oxo-4-hydroxy-4-carboxy--5-ureidoimidazoline (OHCU) decarboxylase [Streptomyces griseochromogenes]
MTRGSPLPAHRLPTLPKPLDTFNTASSDEARALLLNCLRCPRWSRRVADHRPYPDLDSLLAAADEAAYDLSPEDLAEALAGESLPELPEDTYSVAHTALSAAHAAYEARFGHVFVIYLGDCPREEALDRILEGIRSRLTNDPEEERVMAAEQLRRLAGERLGQLLRGAELRLSAAPPRGAATPNAPGK